jgi:hypothetical protein
MRYAADENGKFKCPVCSGTWFRTTDTSPTALSVGGQPVACKDEHGTGCHWKGYMRRPGAYLSRSGSSAR